MENTLIHRDLSHSLFDLDVIGTCLKRRFHQLVLVLAFGIDEDLAFLVEHEADTAGRAHVAAVAGERVANVRRGAVVVLGQALHKDGDAGRAVALIGDLFVIDVLLAFCFLNCTLDRVVRHVRGLALGDDVAKLAVAVRVRAAFLDGNDELTAEFGKDLAALRVGLFFLMFNVGKF